MITLENLKADEANLVAQINQLQGAVSQLAQAQGALAYNRQMQAFVAKRQQEQKSEDEPELLSLNANLDK